MVHDSFYAVRRDGKPFETPDASDTRISFPLLRDPASALEIPETSQLDRTFLSSLGWPAALIDEFDGQARSAGTGLVRMAIAAGALEAAQVYRAVARALAFSDGGSEAYRIVLPPLPTEAWRLLAEPIAFAVEGGKMAALNAQTMGLDTLAALAQSLGAESARIKLLTRQDVVDAITKTFGRRLVVHSIGGLMAMRADWSAKSGLAAWQGFAACAAIGFFTGAFSIAPREAIDAATLFLSIFFSMAIALRFAALAHLAVEDRKPAFPDGLLTDADLPVYTVFVPLFKEVDILPHLARALSDLDYPAAKLDIKVVLESVDRDTIEEALKSRFPGNVDFIIVPDRQPRTKPKALNYALQFATGELAVIFDAEDRPEPDQLRKAATAFSAAPPRVACLQARLDYFNATENWLSRQFAIEYASLFRGILPLLSRYGLPLPLGGTSNHFRMTVLREVGAWDAFNVTEDADLGMRLHRAGYLAQTLDSTTCEEACCRAGPWIKQRTRWLKGWMQTYGVHMRHPRLLMRETGLAGFVSFHAYFAGIVVSALAYPLSWIVILYDALTGSLFEPGTGAAAVFDGIAIAIFAGGFVSNIALAVLATARSDHSRIATHAIFIPVYWFFVSAAAYRAVWQLFRAPFYWEKTEHGVSAALRASHGPR